MAAETEEERLAALIKVTKKGPALDKIKKEYAAAVEVANTARAAKSAIGESMQVHNATLDSTSALTHSLFRSPFLPSTPCCRPRWRLVVAEILHAGALALLRGSADAG